ncbi:Z1 domain-containing protein [Rufibacter aurantiacus]|uniref:Z1 domain-containing protein n=1 Tax=Rufibacter aurantiacus TaxID=2817374 RepID=UPI001B314EB8|nr:Z1 domain-containing protein [Rufibacter aurantiacus]
MKLFYDVLTLYRMELDDLLSRFDRKPNQDELEQIIGEIRESISAFRHIRRQLELLEASDVESLFDKVAKEIRSSVVTINKPGTLLKGKNASSWITEERIRNDQWHYWTRYKEYLGRQGRAFDVLEELDKSTQTIAELLGDPLSKNAYFTKGVVVGNVQSGKTGNFNGVINRAIDLGYKLIIVFSGIMDDLRAQTQDRIEKDVIGWGTLTNKTKSAQGVKGVGQIREFGNDSGIFQVESITSCDTDFSRRLLDANFAFANTKILVCKKNHSVLANLIYWIHTSIPEGHERMDVPLLVLDDEADNASLNNLGYKGIEYAGKVNGHIRALMGLFNKKSYLGYTATPFANILQDQNEGISDFWEIRYRRGKEEIVHKHALTESLFPDDFIFKLNAPSNYVGPKLMFEHGQEEEGERKLPIISIIGDYRIHFPPKAKKGQDKPAGMPESLKDAIDCFVLSIALRLSREKVLVNTPGYNPHHTMLVHVSLLTDWQNSAADKIAEYLEGLQKDIASHSLNDENGIYARLEKQWNRYFAYEVENIHLHLPEDYHDQTLTAKEYRKDIIALLPASVKDLEIKAVNSERGHKLEYRVDSNGKGKKYIAVGGNRLSRGFTLEGLSVNYFIRCTSHADTLLQMGRWFGYRPGYVDACKVFMDSDSLDKFNFITRTLTELEDRIETMNREGLSPARYALRIRNDHDTLRITRPAILKNANTVRFTFREKLVETYRFKLEADKLKRSWEQFEALLKEYSAADNLKVEESKTDGKATKFYKIRTDKDGLFRFLDQEHSFIATDSFTLGEIKAYINLANDHGFLKNWTIAIQMSGSGGKLTSEVLQDVDLSLRSGPGKNKKGVPGNYYNDLLLDNIFRVASGRIVTTGLDEAVNLPEELKSAAVDEFKKAQADEIIKTEKISFQEALAKANKKTLPGSIFRRKRSANEGLLLVYLLNVKEIFHDDKLQEKAVKEGFDFSVPLIGFGFSFPANDNDPGGEFLVNETQPDDGEEEETDELDFIDNVDEPVSVD